MNCSGGILGGFVYIAKYVVYLTWMVGPILAIISLTYNFALMVKDPEEKKTPKKIRNSFIALLLLFFIPTIVNAVVNLSNNDISRCWQSANFRLVPTTYFEEIEKKNRSQIITNQDDYQSGEASGVTGGGGSEITNTPPISGDCSKLPNCTKYITSLVNNSQKINDAILKNNASVFYSQDTPQSWAEAISVASAGRTLKISCNRPSQWSMRDITGEYRDFYSWEPGGFTNYAGPMVNLTKQYKFDGSMTFKTAIQKGYIQTGDIVGTRHHTFSIYSVNTKEGSAVVFDGGHRYTDKCQDYRKCSTMFVYDADNNANMNLYQLIRWIS